MGNPPPPLLVPPPHVASGRNYIATCEYCSRREASGVLYCQGCGALLPGDLPMAILSPPPNRSDSRLIENRYDPDLIGTVWR